MYRKILITGVTAAAIVGAGGAALATTGSDSPSSSGTPGSSGSSSSPSSSNSAAKHDHKGKHHKMRRLQHGQFVSGKGTKTVTHDVIRGTVTSVSATSITVQSADKKSETFAVSKDTKVRVREHGSKGAESTISKVAKGDRAMVAGTGTSKFTAKHVLAVQGGKTK